MDDTKNGPQGLEQESRIRRVDVTRIRDNPYQSRFRWQPRTSEEKEEERRFLLRLVESIRARDLFHPLVVTQTKDGKIQLVSGTARRDAMLLALREFPDEAEKFRYPMCLFIDEPSPEEWMLRTYEENSIRREIDPIKEAEYFQYLKSHERLTQREIAGLLGISEAQVSSRLALLRDPQVRGRVEKGELSATAGRERVWARSTKGKKKAQKRQEGQPLEQFASATSGEDAELPVLAILNEIAIKLDRLLKQAEALGRDDRSRLGVEPREVQRMVDRIVEQGLKLRRAFLR